MNLLQRLLTARLLRDLTPSTTEPRPDDRTEPTTPVSVRLPADLRATLEGIAETMDWSLHKTVVASLQAVTEMDPLARQVILIRERVRLLFRTYGLDVHQVQTLIPELTPDTLANDDLLSRALTPAVIDRISTTFGVARRWLNGQSGHAAPHAWYVEPRDPVTWATDHGVHDVQYYWHTAPQAPWLTEIPKDDSGPSAYLTHLGLIAVTEVRGPVHRLVHHWHSDRMDYWRTRAVARIIATRLHQLGARQTGMVLTADQYKGLTNGTLLAAEIMADRARGSWDIADTLLIGRGLYQGEDAHLQGETWAGADELQHNVP